MHQINFLGPPQLSFLPLFCGGFGFIQFWGFFPVYLTVLCFYRLSKTLSCFNILLFHCATAILVVLFPVGNFWLFLCHRLLSYLFSPCSSNGFPSFMLYALSLFRCGKKQKKGKNGEWLEHMFNHFDFIVCLLFHILNPFNKNLVSNTISNHLILMFTLTRVM